MPSKEAIIDNVDQYSPVELARYIRDGIVTYEELCEEPEFSARSRREVQKLISNSEEDDWQNAVAINTIEEYDNYLQTYPEGKHRSEAREAKKNLSDSSAANEIDDAWNNLDKDVVPAGQRNGLVSNGMYEHHKKRGFAWAEFCYGAVAVLILGFICWGVIALCNWLSDASSVDGTESQIESPIETTESEVDSANSIELAIAYLDSNSAGVWHRDSLIKYKELELLFEELNAYEVDSILKRAEVLKESTQFKRIVDAFKQNRDKILANKGKEYKGPFCSDGDLEITVDNYIKKLNKQLDNPSASSSKGNENKKINNAQPTHEPDPKKKEKGTNENKKNKHGNVM